jgi:8-oxo-dGTP diphosphatase
MEKKRTGPIVKRYSGRTSTAIIEFEPQTILLVKRDTLPSKGFWALPGGRAEPSEEVEQTIVRKVKEETGLDVEIVRKIGEYHEQGTREDIDYDYYPACFLVKVIGGKLRRQESEIQEIKLFRFEDIPENLAFVHNEMVRDFLASR